MEGIVEYEAQRLRFAGEDICVFAPGYVGERRPVPPKIFYSDAIEPRYEPEHFVFEGLRRFFGLQVEGSEHFGELWTLSRQGQRVFIDSTVPLVEVSEEPSDGVRASTDNGGAEHLLRPLELGWRL